MALTWPDKDPDEVLDYHIDWTKTLDGDTIVSSVWIGPGTPNLTRVTNSTTTTRTTMWLAAGVAGERYELTNRITTAGGRTYDQTVRIRVRSK